MLVTSCVGEAWFKFIQRTPSRLKAIYVVFNIDEFKTEHGGRTKGKNSSFKAWCLFTLGNLKIKAALCCMAYLIVPKSFICKCL